MLKKDLQEKVKDIKLKCLELCINAGEGHITSAFSCAEIVCVLYYEIMKILPYNQDERDRFVMSKNHGSVITYPILRDLGFFNKEYGFLKNGSLLGPHTKLNVEGIDFAGGSLGIGLGVACGMAYSAKYSNQSWLTFCIVGDGELYEGSIWEAIMFAAHNKLSNLVLIIDRNQLCMTGFTEKMLQLEPISDKLISFGWEVRSIDGHNIDMIKNSLADVRTRIGKPLCILANTVKGKGITFMENNPFAHGVVPIGDKALIAKEEVINYEY